jgi:heme exporter protein C
MLQPLLVMIAGFYLFYALAVLLALRSEILEREERARWVEELVGA